MAEIVLGVRELKAHLSAYLREVKRGQTIVITRRGQPIARIVPAGPETSLRERMDILQKAGFFNWNGKKLTPNPPVAVNNSNRLISDIVLEQRGPADSPPTRKDR